jgi:hypothetical protein
VPGLTSSLLRNLNGIIGVLFIPVSAAMCLNKLTIEAAIDALSLSCLVPGTEDVNAHSRSSGIHLVAAATDSSWRR